MAVAEMPAPKKRAERATCLIQKATVKKRALHFSKTLRAGKFTRVSDAWLQMIAAKVDNVIQSEVQRHPTLGKTLLP